MSQCNIANRTIFCHDNLEVLQGLNSNCIDLIYLDPPFNKKKTFAAPIGSSAEGASFADIFREKDVKDEWLETIKEDRDDIYSFLTGIKNYSSKYNFCYLAYMAVRLIECHRVLKKTGSIYLHCDSTISHYLKILMDCIFGESNFRNEIVWSYQRWTGATKYFQRMHDIILFHSQSANNFFKQQTESYSEKSKHKGKRFSSTESGKVVKQEYVDANREKAMRDVWDMSIINAMAKERTGYPTQKPLALLERIIKASSKKGGMVLDPFCGCATTCIAAEKLGRRWIGIDVSHKAYDLVKIRLEKEVADPEHLFDSQKDLHFSIKPPSRTDRKRGAKTGKYVYVISHKKHKGWYKVGIASNVAARLNSYQTSDPGRAFTLEFSLLKEKFRECEKYVHRQFENQFEWVKGDLAAIINAIKKY